PSCPQSTGPPDALAILGDPIPAIGYDEVPAAPTGDPVARPVVVIGVDHVVSGSGLHDIAPVAGMDQVGPLAAADVVGEKPPVDAAAARIGGRTASCNDLHHLLLTARGEKRSGGGRMQCDPLDQGIRGNPAVNARLHTHAHHEALASTEAC